jgi:DNA-directed RNA polymerase specialized sigma24 family protein
MADDAKAKARKAVRRAQADFDRMQDAAQQARRQAFVDAQKAGLSLREIADEVDMHRSRIHQIIRGD